MRAIAIIPARYASTRFPAKPLAQLGGKPIIEWVYRIAEQLFERVVVATDDSRIADAVTAFGGEAVMTSTEHRCGTERCAEALKKIDGEWDVVVNIQGDEPFTTIEQLRSLVALFENPRVEIATLATPIRGCRAAEDILNPNIVKVAITPHSTAQYFSRSAIPHLRGIAPEEWANHHTFYRHVGIYAFRSEVLRNIVTLEPTPLECAESLEQLRWLENGYTIGIAITEDVGIGIDTPEDLRRAEEIISKSKL
ncbi:MAG: 3-deoxy-manno-octulosonate cytidylyltransferase [Alistipes sp.]|nr:3-deoxy-manno-octulosonate cytidylyltransferase [Alistipes sp.]